MTAKKALYLTYRPATFADLTGQTAIVRTLSQALKREQVGHAYLFTGPRGTGKTTTARLLAKGLNCANPKLGEPDNTCDMCRSITAGSALDVVEIDAASNRGIDEIRELRDKVRYAPSKAKRKVYIIDEVHMLTKEAFNALLKTLEEPPEFVTFVLATTEPQKVPQTIASRCQRFDFKPAAPAVIAEHLGTVAKAEGLKLDPEAAELMARHARGSFRDGLSVLDLIAGLGEATISADLVREVLGLASLTAVANLERALVAHDAAAAMEVLGLAAEQGTAAETFRLALIDYLRTLMLAKVGAPAPKKAAALAADWSLSRLTAAIRAYLVAGDLMAAATTPELPLEVTTLELLAHEAGDTTSAGTTAATGSSEHPMTEPVVTKAAEKATPKKPQSDSETLDTEPHGNGTTPAGPDNASEPTTSKPAGPATELWEALLLATKDEYSLSVCLQKTRPIKLTKDRFQLAVESEFFLKKLSDPATTEQVAQHAASHLGHSVKLEFSLAEPSDPLAEALQVFEGAEVE